MLQFYKRTTAVFVIILTVMALCGVRVMFITSDKEIQKTANSNNTVSLAVAKLRKGIFDCNLSPLVNTKYKIIAAVSPTPAAVTAISKNLKGQEKTAALNRLKQGKPALVTLKKQINAEGVNCIKVPVRTTKNTSALHLLGYVNAENRGKTGIEQGYDDYLFSNETLKFVFAVDGHGKALYNVPPKLQGDISLQNSGIALTLDGRIQSITNTAMQQINCGAAVVIEVESGKIRAMVSRPSYDPQNLEEYLNDADSPLVNRALRAYNVGSVFKPCVAAAALEKGISADYYHNCTGSYMASGRTFACNKAEGHGNIGMMEALNFSCNTYFYDLAIKTGASALYDMAKSLNFGNSITLANGIKTSGENLTPLKTLSASDAAVANLAIGQGSLLLSPVAVGYMYTAIAGDGSYTIRPLTEGTVVDGKLSKTPDNAAKTYAMSKKTAKMLREYLVGTVQYGTGTKAKPQTGGAGGKTASAQTGWKTASGEKVTQGWFCGFFPADEPKYVAVVLAENVSSGGSVCAPVFAAIADGVNGLTQTYLQ